MVAARPVELTDFDCMPSWNECSRGLEFYHSRLPGAYIHDALELQHCRNEGQGT